MMAVVKVETGILDLPDESILLILRYLNFQDLVRLSGVCERLRAVVCDDSLWKWQCQYYYLVESCVESSWKDVFIKMHKEYGKYIKHYRDIRGAWNKMETFLQNQCPRLFESLQGGTSEENINRVEMDLFGSTDIIPLDLRLSYRIHNGQQENRGHLYPGLMGGGLVSSHIRTDFLLPIDDNYTKILSDGWNGTLFLTFCHRTRSGHCMPLDLNDDVDDDDDDRENCKCGSVYTTGRDLLDDDYHGPVQFYFVASSFKDWLCNYAEDLEKNVFHILYQQFIFKFYPEPGCIATTSAVTVKPTTVFMPELSGPPGNYFFAYRIIMSMDNDAPPDLSCQLESRHWVITYGDGREEVVDGPGVVGEYPIMKPGSEYAWISCCTFHTKSGSMRGFFTMRNLLTGVMTEVECPRFHMKVPPIFTMAPSLKLTADDHTDTESSENCDDEDL